MSDVGGAGFTNFLTKGRPVEPGEPASKRRHVWEMYGDVRVVNKYLLFYGGFASVAMTMMALVIFAIYTRPPYILTQDQGFIMWRTTEVFKLKPDMVSSYIWLVISKLYNKVPGAYDLSSIMNMVAPNIIDTFTGKAGGGDRLSKNERQYFDILEIKRIPESRFPKFISFIIKGNKSISREIRDAAGNVVTETTAETDYIIIWLDLQYPTPENPWGLSLVGLEYLKGREGEAEWKTAVALNDDKGTKLPDEMSGGQEADQKN
jgi:hypothetical protein